MTKIHRVPMPDTASGIVGLKDAYGSRHIVVPVIGTNAELVLKPTNRQIQVRRMGRRGGINDIAAAMKACGVESGTGSDKKTKFTACLQRDIPNYQVPSSLAGGYVQRLTKAQKRAAIKTRKA